MPNESDLVVAKGVSIEHFTIAVSIATSAVRPPKISYLLYPGLATDAARLKVPPFSRIGWIVTHVNPPRKNPPYKIIFGEPGFFDREELVVDRGGHSGFVTGRRLRGRVKYTLVVPSLGVVDDPEVQVDDGVSASGALAAPDFEISVNLGGMPFTYKEDGVSKGNLPDELEVHVCDKIVWNMTPAPPSEHAITFFRDAYPLSPFSVDEQTYLLDRSGGSAGTGPHEVLAQGANVELYHWKLVNVNTGVPSGGTFALKVVRPE